MTKIYIARHGQNVDNANGVLNGHRDLPLTGVGKQQARDLGEGIRDLGLHFDVVYSSPLIRAFETAEIISEIANLPRPVKYDSIIERNFGVMTGKKVSDIEKLCSPDIIRTDTITYFLCPEGAETFDDLIARGKKVLDNVRSLHPGQSVLLVCHGDVGKMIYASAIGKDWNDVLVDFHFGNGELIDASDGQRARMIKLEQHNY